MSVGCLFLVKTGVVNAALIYVAVPLINKSCCPGSVSTVDMFSRSFVTGHDTGRGFDCRRIWNGLMTISVTIMTTISICRLIMLSNE